MEGSIDLSIIIPAFNEEKRICFTLEKLIGFLVQRSWRCEIIVVDDGSLDRTVCFVEDFAVRLGDNTDPGCTQSDFPCRVSCLRNEQNRGKGYSVRHGVAWARGRYIGFMDADYKTEVQALDEVFERLEQGCDGVIGDRTLDLSQIVVGRRPYRQVGSRLFRWLLRWFLGVSEFGDTQCGFKFFQRSVAINLFAHQLVNGFMFDVEIAMLAIRSGYRFAKIPVVWSDDPDSRFKPFTGSLRNLRELVYIYWRHRG